MAVLPLNFMNITYIHTKILFFKIELFNNMTLDNILLLL